MVQKAPQQVVEGQKTEDVRPAEDPAIPAVETAPEGPMDPPVAPDGEPEGLGAAPEAPESPSTTPPRSTGKERPEVSEGQSPPFRPSDPPLPFTGAARPGLAARPGALAVAFFLGAASMGVVSLFVLRSERRAAAAALASALAAAPPPTPVTGAPIVAASAAASAGPGEAVDAAPAPPPPPPVWRIASLANDPSVSLAQGEVGKRTLLTALGAAGLPKPEVYRVLKAFEGKKGLDHCGPKDTYAFAKDKESGKVVAFEYAVSPLEVWQARDEGGIFEAKKVDLAVAQKRVAVGITVGEDLRASVVQAGLDDDMLKMLDDALEGHAELADLRPGARLRLVATEDRVDGVFARYAELDAVEYTPANPSAPKLRVYWYGRAPSKETGPHAHLGGFYDGKGQQPYHGGWRTPVPLARIASRFNPRRMHPVLHVIMPHNGVDFAAPPGTPVYASASGTVKTAGDGGPCGNMVQIQHTAGLVSSYCHMSRFAAGIHVGQHVDQRQLVGYVGQTGRATGPHLHFAIKRGDVFLDPLAFKLDGVRVLPPSLRDDFAKERVEMDLALEAIPMPAAGDGGAASGAGTADGGAAPDETVFDDSPGLE